MKTDLKYLLLNLPDVSGSNLDRSYAGGFGLTNTLKEETLLPIHLLYGASALKENDCEYDILDTQVLGYGYSQTIDAVVENDPDILVSWISLPSLYDDLKLLNEIKERKPNTIIVALGAVCNVMPEEILVNNKVDLVIRGVYPYYSLISNLIDTVKCHGLNQDALHKIAGAIYVKDGEIQESPIEPSNENLDNLIFDTYYHFPINKHIRHVPDIDGNIVKCISIVTSVGCPYACVYCPYPIGYGRKTIHKSISRILNEIEFLNSNFNIGGFSFRDQLFTHNEKRVMQLCDEIISRKLHIKWHAEVRSDEVSREILKKMKDSGCFRLHFGVETGSPNILGTIGKPGLDIETIETAFQITKELGIVTTAHMMLGLPGENKQSLRESIDLLRRINPDVANFNITTPYPGTKLFKIASEKGLITTYDWSQYTSYNAIMKTGEMSAEQVFKAREELKRQFRNYKLLHDSKFRMLYLKRLAAEVYHHLISSFNGLFPRKAK